MLSSTSKKSPKVQNLIISAEFSGQRLDNFLFTYLKGVPKTRIYRAIRSGEVRVNKGRIKPDYRLVEKDTIRIPPFRLPLATEQPIVPKYQVEALENCILYEDNALLILNKPSGMAVHGGSGVSLGVIEALRQIRGRASPMELVHRLDRETSGCLMIAKKRSCLKSLHQMLQAGEVEKRYWLLVQGDWSGGRFIDAPLQKNCLSSGERIVRVSLDGKSARTEFSVLQRFGVATLLEANLLTGRTHQIRVHAAHAGHPVAGDEKYGDATFNKNIKTYGVLRLFLHAKKITLKLPHTGEQISIEAPLERALTDSLDHLSQRS